MNTFALCSQLTALVGLASAQEGTSRRASAPPSAANLELTVYLVSGRTESRGRE